MFASRNNGRIIVGLLATIFLWGGNNTGVKFLVQWWPPIMIGSTRFITAGLLMFALLKWTSWLGENTPLTPAMKHKLWWRGAISLAGYVTVFNMAMQFTAASHVALYLAVSPIWALLFENHSQTKRHELFIAYGAALMALTGVIVLFLPVLKSSNGSFRGELLGLLASLLWANYGRQCRVLSQNMSGAAVSAHTMWRAGVFLLPLVFFELHGKPLIWKPLLLGVHLYCIIGGGFFAFIFWNNGLRHWKTSEVYLFNNLIPLSTMLWAHFCIGEPITKNFWAAMLLIVGGVLISQTKWEKILGQNWIPLE